MQVAATQTSRALAALRSGRGRGPAHRRRRARSRPTRRPTRIVSPTTLDRATRRVEAQPRVRRERVVAAHARMLAGRQPSAHDVAEMILRRSVCDLLRHV